MAYHLVVVVGTKALVAVLAHRRKFRHTWRISGTTAPLAVLAHLREFCDTWRIYGRAPMDGCAGLFPYMAVGSFRTRVTFLFSSLFRITLSPLAPQPRYGNKPLEIRVVCPSKGTAALKGIAGRRVQVRGNVKARRQSKG